MKVGKLAPAEEIAATALAQLGEGKPALRARFLNTLAIIHNRQDHSPEAIALWQEALSLARQTGDDHLILMIAHNLGLPHAVAGNFRRASECFRILTSSDNPRLGPEEGTAYLNLARIATLEGRWTRASVLLGEACEIARKWRLQGLLADARSLAQVNASRAPRDRARSRSSRTNIHAPSPSTNPSRFAENGRDARGGSRSHAVETIRIMANPSMMPRTTVASTPPVRNASAAPNLISRKAYPSASVDDVHPVETTWEGPRSPKRIESSEDNVPIVPEGIAYTEAFLTWFV